MRREAGLGDDRLHPAEARRVPDQRQSLEQPLRRQSAAAELERQHSTISRHLVLRDLMIRVPGQSRVMHPRDTALTSQPRRQFHRIRVLALDAHVQRLEAPLEQPAGEGIGRLSPHHHLLPHLLHVRGSAQHDSTEHVVMPVEVLGGAVDHDVRPVFQRPEIHRAGERRVDHQRDPLAARQPAQGNEVDDAAGGIRRGLEKERPCLPPEVTAPLA